MFVLHRRLDTLVYIVDWSIATLQPFNESKKVQHAMTEEIPITAIFGPVPDGLDLAEDQRLGHNVSVAALLIIATIGVALRIAARVVQKSGLQADDYLIIVALVSCFGLRNSSRILTETAVIWLCHWWIEHCWYFLQLFVQPTQ
jgi:hypothetical protein